MNKLKRFLLQVFLWLGIWSFLWVSSGSSLKFIITNSLVFLLQILFLAAAIYYLIPKLLFTKKHLIFIGVSIVIILLGVYLISEIKPPPISDLAKGPPRQKHPKLPSQFFINLLIITISYVLAVLLETFVFVSKREKDIAYAKTELKESQLKFLKMQINPHFLFNALNNIYALSVTDSDKTQESITTLSDMLRYVIYDCERPKVSLRKEVDYINAYINLFKLRSSKIFNISFNEDIENDMIKVAPMLFVPFIENAFKHSGVEKGEENFVDISLVQKGNDINFIVKNSIPTLPNNTDGQGGIGLPNVQKRLDILYPEAYELNITKTGNFIVTLKLNTQ